MANQYLIKTDDKTVKAWVFVGIINGLEEMFRIKIPVLDVFGSKDWEITQVGAYERKKQIMKIKGSDQVVVPGGAALLRRQGRRADHDHRDLPRSGVPQRRPATAASR